MFQTGWKEVAPLAFFVRLGPDGSDVIRPGPTFFGVHEAGPVEPSGEARPLTRTLHAIFLARSFP